MKEIIITIIGLIGTIVTTWITSKYYKRKTGPGNDTIIENKVSGDVVTGDKTELHEHIHLKGAKTERKNAFVYFLEIVFMFIFTSVAAGALFGGIGFSIAKEVGAIMGGIMGVIAGIVNAGSVKRTKGII